MLDSAKLKYGHFVRIFFIFIQKRRYKLGFILCINYEGSTAKISSISELRVNLAELIEASEKQGVTSSRLLSIYFHKHQASFWFSLFFEDTEYF